MSDLINRPAAIEALNRESRCGAVLKVWIVDDPIDAEGDKWN